MKDYRLSKEQLNHLRRAHRRERNKRKAYRINVICLLGQGWSAKSVSEALLLDEDTIRNYGSRYHSGGLIELLEDKYVGRESELTEGEKSLLVEHLTEVTYPRIKDILSYVQSEFDVEYSRSGMTRLLHELGFTYRKPKRKPGRADEASQKAFIQKYRAIRSSMTASDSLFFLDACHPHHQSVSAFGWIKKGAVPCLKTTAQKKKLNIQGAVDIDTHEVITGFEPWLTESSTIAFLETLRKKRPHDRLYLVLDRAPYYRGQEVKKYAKTFGIDLLYLPPYSPNLNPIERLWLYFQKQIIHNRYYQSLKAFEYSCRNFFKNTRHHKRDLASLITDNFQALPT
jgi:transposase